MQHWVGGQAVRHEKLYKCLHFQLYDIAGSLKVNDRPSDCREGIPLKES